MHRKPFRVIAVAAASLAIVLPLTGCSSERAHAPIVQQIVLVKLNNAADYREFGLDCFNLLAVPGVVQVITGPRLQLGGISSTIDFNAGVEIGLNSIGACVHMAEHPAYRALLDKWRTRSATIHTAAFSPQCDDAPVK